MTGTLSPLRIEIVDPVAEPRERDGSWTASAAAPVDTADGWAASLADAVAAATHHLNPLRRLAGRWRGRSRRVMRAASDRSVQIRHDGSPRKNSVVREHLFAPIHEVGRRCDSLPAVLTAGRGTTLSLDGPVVRARTGAVRIDATLALWASWPRLPVEIRVEPWWREQSRVSVGLRTRRRVRYPRRYFRSAHAAARAVGDHLTAAHFDGR